jgi:hypothetical protein
MRLRISRKISTLLVDGFDLMTLGDFGARSIGVWPFLRSILAVFVGMVAVASPVRAATPVGAQAAFVATIAPDVASYGESVTITGIGFGGPSVVIRVNGIVAPVVSATGTRVTFRVPIGVPQGAVVVTVTNPGGHTGSISFAVSGIVTLRLDEEHRTSGSIGLEGGVLTTQSNGRTFRLSIPPGALPQAEEIVMTPIVSISGLAVEHLLGGVHFAPEGLQFFKGATLVIDLPEGTNSHGLTGFSAAGNGENFHLVPFTTTGSHIALGISHFSLDLVATESVTAADARGCQTPTLECTYSTLLGQALRQAQQTICGNSNCNTPAEYDELESAILQQFATSQIAILTEWIDKVLDKLRTDALQSDPGLGDGAREYLAWLSQMRFLDVSEANLDAYIPLANNSLGAAFLAALMRANDECDDRRVIALESRIDAIGFLLGVGGLPATAADLRSQFGCQLVVDGTLPATVHFGDAVPFTATLSLRTGGPAGPIAPLGGIPVTLRRGDGCGLIEGTTILNPVLEGITDANGQVSVRINVIHSCVNAPNIVTIVVSASDVPDPAAESGVIAIGRSVAFNTSIETGITVSPENASLDPGAQISYSASGEGMGPLFTWSTTGGTITPGPSATATFTAGSIGGIFGVTATSVDDPSQSQTVAVTVMQPVAGTKLAGVLSWRGHLEVDSLFVSSIEDGSLSVSFVVPLITNTLEGPVRQEIGTPVTNIAGAGSASQFVRADCQIINNSFAGTVSGVKISKFTASSVEAVTVVVTVTGIDNRSTTSTHASGCQIFEDSASILKSVSKIYSFEFVLHGNVNRSADGSAILGVDFNRSEVIGTGPSVFVNTSGGLSAAP